MDYPHSYRFVDDAIISRHSIRAFLNQPVDRAIVADILEVASRAPSGTNMQPWTVHVLTGEARQRLMEVLPELKQPLTRRIRAGSGPKRDLPTTGHSGVR